MSNSAMNLYEFISKYVNLTIEIFLKSIIKYYKTTDEDIVIYQLNLPTQIRLSLDDDKFKDIIANIYIEKAKRNLEPKYYSQILEAIKHGYTKPKEEIKLYHRVYHDKINGTIAYQLNKDGLIVNVDSEKYQIQECTEKIAFKHSEGLLPNAVPTRGATLKDFHHISSLLFPIDEESLIVLKVFIISAFLDIKHPILLLSGGVGSGKSYCAKTLKKVIDPNRALLNVLSNKEDYNRMLFDHSKMIVLNNAVSLESVEPFLVNTFEGTRAS